MIKERISKIINDIKFKEEQKILEKKNKVINLINRKWTPEQVEAFNINAIFDSNGTVGGNYSEQTIKSFILMENKSLFTVSEYEELENSIYSPKIIK